MTLVKDKYWDEFVDLPNGKKALICYTWEDVPARIVISAEVLVEDDLPIGTVTGPMTPEEANEKGAKLASDWYQKRESNG